MRADFHTHILPCVDDGSRSVEQSLEMLRRCQKMGIRHVVLTPHFYADQDHPDRFFARRNEALSALQKAMEGEKLPALIPGAEVHYFPNMSSSNVLPKLAIGSSPYILVEMPMCRWTERMFEDLEMIRANQGLTPIIAHLDRYLTPFNSGKILRQLADLPVLVQVNGEAFLQRRTARLAMRMLERGQIQLLGSDCHNLTDRKPNLGPVRELIRSKLGVEPLKMIAYYEQQVIGGETANEETQ